MRWKGAIYLETKIPSDIDAERSIIASILLEPDSFDLGCKALKPAMFYDARHAAMFESIVELAKDGHGIDMLTVANRLKSNGKLDFIGGHSVLMEIQSSIASTSNVEGWCSIIIDCWCRREIATTCDRFKHSALDESKEILATCSDLETATRSVAITSVPQAAKLPQDIIRKAIEDIQSAYEEKKMGGNSPKRVMTGIKWIDREIKFYRGGLSALGADTGVGKTTLALQMFGSQAIDGDPTPYFCSESSAEEIFTRVCACKAGLRIEDALEPPDKKTLDAFNTAATLMNKNRDNWMIYGEEDWDSDIDKLCYLVEMFYKKHGRIGMWTLDHFQDLNLASGKNDADKFESVKRVMTKCKRLSAKTDSSGLILAQVNKISENQKYYTINSFYGSKFFTQPLRLAFFINNKDYKPGMKRKPKEDAEIYSAKDRLGGGFFIPSTFIGSQGRFYPQVIAGDSSKPVAYYDENNIGHVYDKEDEPQ